MLEQATANPPLGKLDDEVKPTKFVDGLLRERVQRLVLQQKNDQSTDRAPKRRRLNDDPPLLLELAGQLCQLVDADPSSEVEDLESHIMCE